MEPPNKHSRTNDEPTMSQSLPDLSTLPESVLVHILSFMDPKEAVQTCVLSKQWRNLWTCIPSLNFDKRVFKGTGAAFVHFVTNMLYFRRASKLHTFRLYWQASQHKVSTCSEEICQIHVSAASAWIFSALSCKPVVISLNLQGFTNLKLPHALFTCASLEQLKLYVFKNNEEDVLPKYVNLTNLKKLRLRSFTLNNPVMQGILSGCPLLEKLFLCGCSLNFSEMKSDLVREFIIVNSRGSGVVEICMPNLVSLYLVNDFPRLTKLYLKNTPSLVNVFVCYRRFVEYYISGTELEFFNRLTTVRYLNLYGGVKGLLEKIVLNCPIFNNLKQLSCGPWSINENLDVLCQFLQHTPRLEKLTIYEKPAIPGNAKQQGTTHQIPFRCEQLKTIEIKYSDPSGVHELVDLLLANISQSRREFV